MSNARCELPKRAQLIRSRRALAFFLLLGYIARNTQHAGCSSFDHQRRIVDACISQLSIMSEVTHFIGLRQSLQSSVQFFADQLAIAFMHHAEQRPPDKVTTL